VLFKLRNSGCNFFKEKKELFMQAIDIKRYKLKLLSLGKGAVRKIRDSEAMMQICQHTRKGWIYNEGKPAASFCHQVAAWASDMLCNFYAVKNHKIALNSTTNKAGEKISTDLETLEFQKFFDSRLTKFKNNYILLDKISHWFLLTAKLFSGWKILLVPMTQGLELLVNKHILSKWSRLKQLPKELHSSYLHW
jgi:hypothetical protein